MQRIGSTKKETEFRKQMMTVVQESELILNIDQDVPKAPLSGMWKQSLEDSTWT